MKNKYGLHKSVLGIGMLGMVALVGLLSACGSGGGGGSAAPAGWTGTKQLGAAGASTYGYGVAVDAGGNVYVAGLTNGGLDGNTLTGVHDFFQPAIS